LNWIDSSEGEDIKSKTKSQL